MMQCWNEMEVGTESTHECRQRDTVPPEKKEPRERAEALASTL